MKISDGLWVNEGWVVERFFAASSGPGGQHVNKVATAVELRLDVGRLEGVWPADVVARVRLLCGRRLGKDGWVVLVARGARSQAENRKVARARLVALLAKAAEPVEKRVATKPTRGSVRRRLDAKRALGVVKGLRGKKGLGTRD